MSKSTTIMSGYTYDDLYRAGSHFVGFGCRDYQPRHRTKAQGTLGAASGSSAHGDYSYYSSAAARAGALAPVLGAMITAAGLTAAVLDGDATRQRRIREREAGRDRALEEGERRSSDSARRESRSHKGGDETERRGRERERGYRREEEEQAAVAAAVAAAAEEEVQSEARESEEERGQSQPAKRMRRDVEPQEDIRPVQRSVSASQASAAGGRRRIPRAEEGRSMSW